MGGLTVPSNVGQRVAVTALNPSGTFTQSDTWTVPPGVFWVWVDAASGGAGGGGGGGAAGGGGGGGSSGLIIYQKGLRVTPGAVLGITIGGKGLGATVGNFGGNGGVTIITNLVDGTLNLLTASGGNPGGAVNGGAGAGSPFTAGGIAGAGAVGGNSTAASSQITFAYNWTASGGAGGGAVNFNGGVLSTTNLSLINYSFPTAAIGGANGGGGGGGGVTIFGDGTGGLGGSNGAIGTSAPVTNYGAGGGGGSGNFAGSDGVAGCVRIRY